MKNGFKRTLLFPRHWIKVEPHYDWPQGSPLSTKVSFVWIVIQRIGRYLALERTKSQVWAVLYREAAWPYTLCVRGSPGSPNPPDSFTQNWHNCDTDPQDVVQLPPLFWPIWLYQSSKSITSYIISRFALSFLQARAFKLDLVFQNLEYKTNTYIWNMKYETYIYLK